MARPKSAKPKWIAKREHWRLDWSAFGKRRSFYSSTPGRPGAAECRRKALEWEYGLSTVQPEAISFATAWAQFLADYRLRVKETSYRQAESRGKAHLLRRFRKTKLTDITKRDWQAVITDAYNNGARSSATLKGIATIIRSFTRWAATEGYINDNDVPLFFSYPIGATTQPKAILQPEQLRLLFTDNVESNPYLPCFRFIALTGLRRGEFCALQTPRDFDGEFIRVRESISHEEILTEGKTKDAQRAIALPELALEQIHAYRLSLPQEVLEKSPFLFPGPDGGYIKPRALRNAWQTWREQHGITISLHELRHTYISYSSQRTSLGLENLKLLYGHSESMNTEAVYVHPIEKTPEELRAELERQRLQAEQINRLFTGLISE